jgi:glycosyltransferase involved in cell wall biosynthesis
MRILWLHSELGLLAGGGENFSRQLISALLERGHQITTVCAVPKSGSLPSELPDGVMEIKLSGYWNRQFGQGFLSYLGTVFSPFPHLKSLWANVQMGISWRVIRWHNARFAQRALPRLASYWRQFDIAYVHGDPILAAQVSLNLPVCLRLPGPIGISYLPFMRKIMWVCANGDALIQLRSLFQNEVKIHELPIGLDTEHFSPSGPDFRARIGWDRSKTILGYAGRITPLKGVQILMSAFYQIAREFPELRLLLVGDGTEKGAIMNELRNAGMRERVHFVGVQKKEVMPTWYRSMDLVLMPSLYENFSNAVLEAMGCGLPVIASAVGGNLDAVPKQVGTYCDI